MYSFSFSLLYIVVNFFLYAYIPAVSRFEFLRSLNIFTLLNPNQIPGSSEYVNVLSMASKRLPLVTVYTLLTLVIFTVLSIYFFSKSEFDGFTLTPVNRSRDQKLRIWRYRLSGWERYRVIWPTGLIVILLALLFVSGQVNRDRLGELNVDRVSYLRYFREIEGPITDDTVSILTEQARTFDEKDLRIDAIHALEKDETISAHEAEARSAYIEAVYNSEIDIFQAYREEVEALIRLYDEGYTVHALDQSLDDYTFSKDYGRLFQHLFALILLIILMMSTAAEDIRVNMNPLLKSTQKGHKCIIQIRMRIAASWAIVVSILIAVADFMNLQMSGLVISYQAAIQSFPALRTNSSSWSISQLFLFEFVLTALSSIVATWIILALVQLLENYWSAMILSFSVLALPIIYIFVFAESIAYLPAFSLSLNLRFLSIVGLRSHQIISIALILITLILYYLNVQLWSKKVRG